VAATGSKVLDFMTANADKPHSIKAIADATGLTEMQAANAAADLMHKFKQMTRPRRGIYEWVSDAGTNRADEFIVTVVMRKPDGRMLVFIDEDNTKLFVLSPLADF